MTVMMVRDNDDDGGGDAHAHVEDDDDLASLCSGPPTSFVGAWARATCLFG